MRHTKGPWVIYNPENEAEVGNSETKVARINEVLSVSETEANAALIAAAPDMLEALKRIVSSAPIKGLPLALELDIQHAATILRQLTGKTS